MSRPSIFTVFNLNDVYLPHVDIELVDSAFILLACLGCDTWCKYGVVGNLSFVLGCHARFMQCHIYAAL